MTTAEILPVPRTPGGVPSPYRIALAVIAATVALFGLPCAPSNAAPGLLGVQPGAADTRAASPGGDAIASRASTAGGGTDKTVKTPVPQAIIISDDPVGLSDQERAARKVKWEHALQPIARREGASLFFDVNLALPPPIMQEDRPYGTLAMRRLGELMKRRWRQIDGIQVFTRSDENDPTDYRYFDEHILDWLQSLSPQDRTALTQGKLPLSRVDPVTRESIVSWAINLNPGMAATFLERGDEAGLGMAFNPTIEWQDLKTGEHRWWTIELSRPSVTLAGGSSGAAPAAFPSEAPRALDRPAPGQLDFGPGQVLELKDILKRAEAVYGIRYNSDLRLAHATFFVNGRFSRATLADVLKAATAVLPAAESTSHHGDWGATRIASLLTDDFPGLLQDPLMYQPHPDDPAVPLPISSSAFQEQQTATVAEIAGITPLLQELERLGLTPDSVVDLRPAFVFYVGAGGWPIGSSIE